MGRVYLVMVNVVLAVCELAQSLQHRMELLLRDCSAIGHSRVCRHALNVYECIQYLRLRLCPGLQLSRVSRRNKDVSCELACPEKGVAVRYRENLIYIFLAHICGLPVNDLLYLWFSRLGNDGSAKNRRYFVREALKEGSGDTYSAEVDSSTSY